MLPRRVVISITRLFMLSFNEMEISIAHYFHSDERLNQNLPAYMLRLPPQRFPHQDLAETQSSLTVICSVLGMKHVSVVASEATMA